MANNKVVPQSATEEPKGTDTPELDSPTRLQTVFPTTTQVFVLLSEVVNTIGQKATEIFSRSPASPSQGPSHAPTVRLTSPHPYPTQQPDQIVSVDRDSPVTVFEKEREDPEWLKLVEAHEFMPGFRQYKVNIPDLLALEHVPDQIESSFLEKMNQHLKGKMTPASNTSSGLVDAINRLTLSGLEVAAAQTPIEGVSATIDSKNIRPAIAFGESLWRLKEELEAQGFSIWVTIADKDNPAQERIVVAGSVDRDWQANSFDGFLSWLLGNYKFPIAFDRDTILEKNPFPSIVGTLLASQMALDSTGQQTVTYLAAEDIHDESRVPYKVQRNTRLFTEGDKLNDDGSLKEAGSKTIGPFVCIPFVFQINGRTVKFVLQFFKERYHKDLNSLRKTVPDFFAADAGHRSKYLCEKGYMAPFAHRQVLGLIKAFYHLQPTIATYIEQCVMPQLRETVQTIRDGQDSGRQLYYASGSQRSGNMNMLAASTQPFTKEKTSSNTQADVLGNDRVDDILRDLRVLEGEIARNPVNAGSLLMEIIGRVQSLGDAYKRLQADNSFLAGQIEQLQKVAATLAHPSAPPTLIDPLPGNQPTLIEKNLDKTLISRDE